MNIMKEAWRIAEEAVLFHGVGTSKEYFAESLKLAWSQYKSIKVEMTSKHWEKGNHSRQYIKIKITMNAVGFTKIQYTDVEGLAKFEGYYDLKNSALHTDFRKSKIIRNVEVQKFLDTKLDELIQVEQKKLSKPSTKVSRFDKLCDAAIRMSDEDFEDIYDLPREYYL
ncbi:hypothetical protein HB904_03750 [Listeria booriae]|uniref:Uncharacterized protein n=1 Tax=Listeria booriae TaxID=1552123 RepID=A0A842AG86_9LIST|nr:hypothetical protein [Listeria booriae]MBC1615285.1 hypothetical protein [Listeria booriae]